MANIIEGDKARAFAGAEKLDLLYPFLSRYGREALSYATLQDGMEYYVGETGYIAYLSVRHPVFASWGKKLH